MPHKLSMYEIAFQAGLRINMCTTKCVRCNTTNTNTVSLLLHNNSLKDVSEFCYHRSIISNPEETRKTSPAALERPNVAFGTVSPIRQSSTISFKSNIQISNSNVESIRVHIVIQLWIIWNIRQTVINFFARFWEYSGLTPFQIWISGEKLTKYPSKLKSSEGSGTGLVTYRQHCNSGIDLHK